MRVNAITLWRVVVACGLMAFISGPASATDLARDAQDLLNTLGYDAGPVDGEWGRRSGAAIAAFYANQNLTYDGQLDEIEVAALRDAAEAYSVELRSPGQLFDMSYGRQTSCNKLSPGRYRFSGLDANDYPSVENFDDSASIGMSVKNQGRLAWSQALLVNAAVAATQGDERAAAFAKQILLSWAQADAGLGTAIDNRYLGRGNAANYDAEAAAPVLDMDNAAQLGATGLTAAYMLGDHLAPDEKTLVKDWATKLTTKYDMSGSALDGSASGVFMSAYPRLLAAIALGEADRYRALVEAYYDLLRDRVDKNGAILKNANRGDRGIHYQSMGILANLSLFELVENQGSKIPGDLVEDMHRAVKFFLDADRDNEVILPYSKMGFNNPGKGQRPDRFYRQNSEHYWWMIDYLSRYPDSENGKRIRALLGPNDTYDMVSFNVMPAVWVPYPINCFKPFDMSGAAIAEAKAYVEEHFPKVAVKAAGGRKLGKPKTKGAAPVTFEAAEIIQLARSPNFEAYMVRLTGLTIDGKPMPFFTFQIFADFGGDAQDLSNLALLRIAAPRSALTMATSRKANFAPCGNVASRTDGGIHEFRLHIGEHMKTNSCILTKMADKDRIVWASLLDGLEAMINTGDTEKGERGRLKELFDFMVY